jgi:hypothetical protein
MLWNSFLKLTKTDEKIYTPKLIDERYKTYLIKIDSLNKY